MKTTLLLCTSLLFLASCLEQAPAVLEAELDEPYEYVEEVEDEDDKPILVVDPAAPDTTAPKVVERFVTSITETSGLLNFSIDESGSVTIDYGPSTGYGAQIYMNATKDVTYKILLDGLDDGTVIHYKLTSVDNDGNKQESGDFTFKTQAAVDVTAPLILASFPNRNLSAAATQTNISVITNESANCKYSRSNVSYVQMANMSSTGDTNHIQLVTGLVPLGRYNYYVSCRDAAGNISPSRVISFAIDSINLNGADLYLKNCAGCHGSLAGSRKRNKSQAVIQNAINNNNSMKNIQYLKALVPAQVAEIAKVLN